ncbi:lysylphosphatidylglycerol synthase domain-containing protein [Myxococcus stipitatus]|uniref:lysylphosphatidylglycerol synthase domain-containing protein n=1 Tax=Myxococcus stipitatus TaxID=83455 RepID=UPI001F3ACCA9|nr:lysylphosphatidylglycerol synthase domain-containing protein [Myxococcus stipitatus]MCE9668795.1 lysylphosphatidylglycerol synthase domain-containing protein [Myxococcus stipitatus]
MKRSRMWALALVGLGLLVSALFLARFLDESRESGQWVHSGNVPVWAVPVAVLYQVVAHVLRTKNAQRLLRVVRPTTWRILFSGLSVGYLFNAILPFRLGELVRAHLIGTRMRISRAVVLFTILFERAVDGLLLGLCALGVVIATWTRAPEAAALMLRLALGVGAVSLTAAMLIWLLYTQNRRMLRALGGLTALLNDRLKDRIRFVLWSLIYGTHVIFRSARLGRFVLTSMTMWALYLASAAALVWGYLPDRDPVGTLGTAVGAYLSVGVPSGPGFVGTFHYYYSELARGLLGITGVPVGLSLVTWAVLIGPFALVGLYFLVERQRERAAAATPRLERLKNKLHRDADISREFSHFLDEYFSGQALSHVLSTGELRGDFRMVRTFKGGSNASTLLVWDGQALSVRKVTLPQHAEKLKVQHDWLLSRRDVPHLPRILRELRNGDFYAFDLEYREQYIPFFQFIHSEEVERSKQVLDRVLDFVGTHIYATVERRDEPALLERYLREKVEDKVRDAAALSPRLAELLTHDTLTINGQRYENIFPALARLRANPRALAELASMRDTPIHGDLTVDNLIVRREDADFLVLDPNNENAISDPVVDLAKLCQSLHSGYEFLCQLERARSEDAVVEYEEATSSRYAELYAHLQRRFETTLPPDVRRTILFHEAVHYCRMLTYRARINADSLPAFFATAVRLFNAFNAQYTSVEVASRPDLHASLQHSA